MPNFEVGSQKTKLKKVKSSIKIQNVFRRVSQGGGKGHGGDSTDSPTAGDPSHLGSKAGKAPAGKLFGLPLDEACKGKNTLPRAIEVSLSKKKKPH